MFLNFRKTVIAATLLSLIVSTVSPNVYTQGRIRTAPARDSESTQAIPAGAQSIPAGTIIILEMDDRLSSGSSKVSDRFRAHVASPVVDGAGKTLIPVGIVIEGHVSSVSKAKWRHRSGIMAIVFDNFRRPNGDPVPIKGTLTSAKAEDRKRLDEEAYLKGGSSITRDIVFIGGGAGTGAAIGIFTGGMLLGAGIGAAAGLTAALLMKGKDVVVEPEERFGMVLTQQVPANLFQPNATPIPTPTPQPYIPPTPTPTPGQVPGSLNPYDVRVIRDADGSVRLRANAEAPSPGWRVFSHHEDLASGVVRIRLRGTPPTNSNYNSQLLQTTITPVPEICLDDRSGLLRRVEFMDKYGRQSFSVAIPYQPGEQYGRAPATPNNPGTGNSGTGNSGTGNPPGYIPPVGSGQQGNTQPTPPSSSLSAAAKSAAEKVDVIRRQFANSIGFMINRSNQPVFIGDRQPTAQQQQFFNGLMSLHASLLRLQNGASDANTVRVNARQVQEDANFANQASKNVSLDQNTNNRWQIAYTEINSLLSLAVR